MSLLALKVYVSVSQWLQCISTIPTLLPMNAHYTMVRNMPLRIAAHSYLQYNCDLQRSQVNTAQKHPGSSTLLTSGCKILQSQHS